MIFSDFLFLGVALAAIAAMAWSAARTYLEYRDLRLITCPETKAPAVIRLDAAHAALSAALAGGELRLKDCSLWPERRHCGQQCLGERALRDAGRTRDAHRGARNDPEDNA